MNEPRRTAAGTAAGTVASTAGAGDVGTAALVDIALVIGFALIGRRSHDEGITLAGIATTAWPFLAALGAGWLSTRAWRKPLALWPTAVVIWAVTVAGGMLLRAVSGQGVQFAFVIVATLTLGTLLIGWRLLARLVGGRSRADVDAS